MPLLVWFVGCSREPTCPLVTAPTVEPGPGGGGNVLILLVDDVGPVRLGPWNPRATEPPMPTVDCLCDRGVTFDQAWSLPLCSPGRAALQTGRFATRTGLGRNVAPDLGLPDEEQTLGELLGAEGYATALVGKWHLDRLVTPRDADGPVRQGYDTFAGTMANIGEGGQFTPLKPTYERYWWISGGVERWSEGYLTTRTVDEALAILDVLPEPFALVVAFHAPHEPIHEPPRELIGEKLRSGASDVEQYDAMLEALDTEMGRLLRGIDPQVLADTTVIYAGDNGVSKFGVIPPYDALVKNTLYEGGLHVPLVVAGPHVAAGSRVEAPVHLVDLFPTLATLTGATPLAELDGVDLSGVLADPDAPGPAWAQAVWTPPGRDGAFASAVRDERYKVVVESPHDVRLYDLQADPLEEDDLYADGAPDAASAELAAALTRGLDLPASDRWSPLR